MDPPSPVAPVLDALPRPVPIAGIPSLGGDDPAMTSLAIIAMWTTHLRGRFSHGG